MVGPTIPSALPKSQYFSFFCQRHLPTPPPWAEASETQGSEVCYHTLKNCIHIKGRAKDPSKSGQHRIFSLLAQTPSQSNLWSCSKQALSCWKLQGWHPQVVTLSSSGPSISSTTDYQSASSPELPHRHGPLLRLRHRLPIPLQRG